MVSLEGFRLKAKPQQADLLQNPSQVVVLAGRSIYCVAHERD